MDHANMRRVSGAGYGENVSKSTVCLASRVANSRGREGRG